MLFKIHMESDKDLNLLNPIGPQIIIEQCKKIAAWTAEHKDEIKSLVKKGWTNAAKIVEYLKKKYHK